MAYLDNYVKARNERLAKAHKPSRLINGARREAVINEVMDRLNDWRMSPFENQGPLHAGLRSALCMTGNGWLAAEIEAASIVGECLRLIGAEYPTWDQGQPEHTIPDDQCKKCGGPMPDEAREGLRRYRFCSNECARAALVYRTYEHGWRSSTLAWSAYRMVLKTKTSPRICRQCNQAFHVVRELSDALYCSKACYNEGRLTRAKITCASCDKPFQPARGTSKFCSRECKDAGIALQSYTVTCVCCGKGFSAATARAKFCGPVCKNKIKYQRDTRRKLPRCPRLVPVHMLTAKVIDGWFARAA